MNPLKPLLILTLALTLCGCKTQPEIFNAEPSFPTVVGWTTIYTNSINFTNSSLTASNLIDYRCIATNKIVYTSATWGRHMTQLQLWIDSNLNASWLLPARILLGLFLFAWVVYFIRIALSEKVSTVPEKVPDADKAASEAYLESLKLRPTDESLANIYKVKENLAGVPILAGVPKVLETPQLPPSPVHPKMAKKLADYKKRKSYEYRH